MKDATKQAFLQKASGDMSGRMASGSAGNVDTIQAIAVISDAAVKYLCRDEITEIELQKEWIRVLPQFKDQFGMFINLMGQVVKVADEYNKLTVGQTNKIIDIINSQPNVPFEEKMKEIRDFVEMQNRHNEKLLGGVLAAGTTTVVATKVGPVAVKKGAEVIKHLGTTSAIKAFSPSKTVTALSKGAVRIIKAVKK